MDRKGNPLTDLMTFCCWGGKGQKKTSWQRSACLSALFLAEARQVC